MVCVSERYCDIPQSLGRHISTGSAEETLVGMRIFGTCFTWRAESRHAPMPGKPAALLLCFAVWSLSVKNVECGGLQKGALEDPSPSFGPVLRCPTADVVGRTVQIPQLRMGGYACQSHPQN